MTATTSVAMPTHAELAEILEVSKRMACHHSLADLLQFLSDYCIHHIGAEHCNVYVLDEEKGDVVSQDVYGHKLEVRLPLGVGIAGECVRGKRFLNIEDAYSHPLFNPSIDKKTGYRTTNVLCVPLRTLSGTANGCLELVNKKASGFTVEDRVFLTAFAAQAAIFLKNIQVLVKKQKRIHDLSRVEKELRYTTQKLAAVYDIERLLHKKVDFKALAEPTLGHIIDALVSAKMSFLLDAKTGNVFSLLADLSFSGSVVTEENYERFSLDSDPNFLDEVFAKFDISPELRRYRYLTSNSNGFNEILGIVGIYLEDAADDDQADDTFLDIIAGQLSSVMERKERYAEEARQDRLAMMGQTLATIIHDFRSPMAAAHSACEYLKMSSEADHPEVISMCNIAQASLDRCSTMIDELLQFAAGRKNIALKMTDLNGLLDQLFLSLQTQAKTLNIEFCSQADIFGTVMLDKEKLFRVVYNLANNAYEAMANGGTLQIIAENKPEYLEIRVEDTGPGIPREIRSQIFVPFFTHGKSTGTGLGLHIANMIVEAHKGTLELDESYNAGAAFVIRLPI